MGSQITQMARLWHLLVTAVLLVGLVSAKWQPTGSAEQRAEVVTELEVNNELMQQASKEYFKFTGQKPPTAPVDDDDMELAGTQSRDVTKMMETLSEAKPLYNVLKVGDKAAREMEKNGTDLSSTAPKPVDNTMTGALVTEVVRDYAKATGKDLTSAKAKKEDDEEITPPQNMHDVMKLMESVGADLHRMKLSPDKKFQGASNTYDTLLDRRIVVPDLKESADDSSGFEDSAMNDAMSGSPKSMEESLGLNPVDDQYQADKAAAQDVLEKQSEKINNERFSDDDAIPDDDDDDDDTANFDSY